MGTQTVFQIVYEEGEEALKLYKLILRNIFVKKQK